MVAHSGIFNVLICRHTKKTQRGQIANRSYHLKISQTCRMISRFDVESPLCLVWTARPSQFYFFKELEKPQICVPILKVVDCDISIQKAGKYSMSYLSSLMPPPKKIIFYKVNRLHSCDKCLNPLLECKIKIGNSLLWLNIELNNLLRRYLTSNIEAISWSSFINNFNQLFFF